MGDSGKDFVGKYINIDPTDQILDHMKSPLINFRYRVIIFSYCLMGNTDWVVEPF